MSPLSLNRAPAGRRPLARLRPTHRTLQRGVAALTVVMVLFFVMALVAAYTNRNLVFEQRISANNYRATRAMEAADAGVEWAFAMLNAGRTTATCGPQAAGAGVLATDFRSRYVTLSPDLTNGEGAFTFPWGTVLANRVYPTCAIVGGQLRCACPAMGENPAGIALPDDGVATAFRIEFLPFASPTGPEVRAGAVQFIAWGCANPGTGPNSCVAGPWEANIDRPEVDAFARVITIAGLVRALPVAPRGTLTAGRNVDINDPGRLEVGNSDFSSGLTAHTGNTVRNFSSVASVFRGPPGSGSEGRLENDGTLAVLNAAGAAQAEEHWFRAMFNMDSAAYRQQPATIRLDCNAGCTRAALDAALATHPRNPIFVTGDLTIDGAGDIGTAADPVLLIVTGTLNIAAATTVNGFVHANLVNWNADGAINGALVSVTDFVTNSVVTMRYDKAILDTIRLSYGSFVRAPAGWNLY